MVKRSDELQEFLCNCGNKSLVEEVHQVEGLLKENYLLGVCVRKKQIPKYYVNRWSVSNLYKYNLRKGWRLIYTLLGTEKGITVLELEALPHPEYERRFGY
jgi:hypothetical protein